jgi:hypothetical protein
MTYYVNQLANKLFDGGLASAYTLETALSFYVDARKPIPVASKAKRG